MITDDIRYEKTSPYIFAVIISGILMFLSVPSKLRMEKDLGNPILTMISIITAITVSSLTIVLSQPIGIKKLQEDHPVQYQNFIKFHFESIVLGIISCVLSMVTLMMCPLELSTNQYKISIFHHLVFYLWLAFTIASLFTFIRISYIMKRILLRYA